MRPEDMHSIAPFITTVLSRRILLAILAIFLMRRCAELTPEAVT